MIPEIINKYERRLQKQIKLQEHPDGCDREKLKYLKGYSDAIVDFLNDLRINKVANSEESNDISLLSILKRYENWEAKLIQNSDSWENGYPEITGDLFEEFLEIQEQRNTVIKSLFDLDGKTMLVKFKVSKFQPRITLD